jgi:hypothetical protein
MCIASTAAIAKFYWRDGNKNSSADAYAPHGAIKPARHQDVILQALFCNYPVQHCSKFRGRSPAIVNNTLGPTKKQKPTTASRLGKSFKISGRQCFRFFTWRIAP